MAANGKGINSRGIVDIGAATEQEVVHRLEFAQLLARTEDVEFRGAEAEGLFPLGFRAGEDDDMASHGGCQLDGQVAQAANTHHTDTIGGADTVFGQDSPNRRTSTHQRRSIGGIISVGNRDHTACIPDDTAAERAKVVVVGAVLLLVLTVLVPSW